MQGNTPTSPFLAMNSLTVVVHDPHELLDLGVVLGQLLVHLLLQGQHLGLNIIPEDGNREGQGQKGRILGSCHAFTFHRDLSLYIHVYYIKHPMPKLTQFKVVLK